MIRLILVSLLLAGCGGGGGSSGGGGHAELVELNNEEYINSFFGCLANERNCTDADVDLNAPVIWAADNGIKVVHIRWAKCADEAALKYAFDMGVTVICLAGSGGQEITVNSPHSITVSTTLQTSNYGAGVDYTMKNQGGTIHAGIWATALVATGQPLGDYEFWGYEKYDLPAKTVLIVDNGFDQVRPIYVLHKNTTLAGEVTGDYGVKAVNELRKWTDAPVIGYVPFNTMPKARIDNWEVI